LLNLTIMKHRIAVVAMMLLTAALPAAAPKPVMAHTYSPSHYSASCITGTENVNTHAFVDRPLPGNSGSYKAVLGRVSNNETSLAACTPHTTDFAGGWSIVVGATGQGTNGNLVQIGIAEQACHYASSANCQHGFTTGTTDFWYTANDDGEIWLFPVDFNGDGTRQSVDHPTVNHTYDFEVSFYTVFGGAKKFQYCVTDVTTGDFDCIYTDRGNEAYWYQVWYGFELYNDASQLGYDYPANGGGISFPLMQYLNSNGSIYTTLTNNPTSACSWYDPNGYGHDGSEHCTIGGGSGTTTIYAYTTLHT
jgi:hypothetical protein